MAIKFTDKTDDDGKPKKPAAKQEPAKVDEPETAADAPPAAKAPEAEGYLPGLAHEKLEPKPRGRKKAFG